MRTILRVDFEDLVSGNPDCVILGSGGVHKITEHSAQGEGDRWYYEAEYDDGSTLMIFNPVLVRKSKEE